MRNDAFPEWAAGLLSDYQCAICLREDAVSTFQGIDAAGVRRLIKVSKDPLGRERLRNEYLLLKRLSEDEAIPPNLFPAPVEMREADGIGVMIREYIPGHSLETLVEGGSAAPGLPEKESCRLVSSLLEQLQILHHLRPPVIHRDIKPQNLVIDTEGRIHLIDFDIARVQRKQSAVDTLVMGTRLTSAPEQFGFHSTDARSDLYSVGVVLRYCLTGSYDSRGDETLSRAMLPVVQKATAFDPDHRYQSAEAFLAALKKTQRKSENRKRPLAYFAAALVVFLVILGGILGRQISGMKGAPEARAVSPAMEENPAGERAAEETSFSVPAEINADMFGGDTELYEMFRQQDFRESTLVISPEGMRFVRYLEYNAGEDPAPRIRLTEKDLAACLDLLQGDAAIWAHLGNILLVNLEIESWEPLNREWKSNYMCLELHHCVLPEDSAPLRYILPHLIELTGSSDYPATNLDWLETENHLQILHLSLAEKARMDLSPLENLREMFSLSLSNYQLDEASLEVLRNLPALQDLSLFYCEFVDDAELSGFEHLENIFIY